MTLATFLLSQLHEKPRVLDNFLTPIICEQFNVSIYHIEFVITQMIMLGLIVEHDGQLTCTQQAYVGHYDIVA
ncbi:hypothetical protein [Photobacterium damselae]|uniref:hypothetical protein n=1 Tax=Photobacterium damselae TaxID=38293 RepID=UPI002F42DC0F